MQVRDPVVRPSMTVIQLPWAAHRPKSCQSPPQHVALRAPKSFSLCRCRLLAQMLLSLSISLLADPGKGVLYVDELANVRHQALSLKLV